MLVTLSINDFITSFFNLLFSYIISFIKFIVYSVFGLFAVALFTLWYYQSLLLYMPTGPELPRIPIISELLKQKPLPIRTNESNAMGMRSPAEYKLRYETHYINTTDYKTLHSWLVLQPTDEQSKAVPTIIFLHGNALNIGIRLYNVKQLVEQCKVNVLIIDYRGFGESNGEPSEYGLKLDIHATIKHAMALQNIDPQKLFLFGRSLGGAVALYGTQQYENTIRGCIVENTFTSINDMVITLAKPMLRRYITDNSVIYTVLQQFLNVFMTSHWRSIDIVKHITTPLLVTSGQQDELVPPAQHKALYDAADKSKYKHLYTVTSGTHNDTYLNGGKQYYIAINEFMKKCLNQ